MTAARARVLPLRRNRADTDPRLVELLADLGRLGVNARILTEEIAGERDVRLHADAVTVELLWCCPDEPAPVCADAVRIVDGESVVWRSLDGRCAAAELVRFLGDLLLLDEDSLARRYLRLG